jgi:uncharacterized membrane protein YesL
MAFEPTAWKIYCPECGQRKIGKAADGSFCCSECGCEFRHNWKAWVIAGAPFCMLALVIMLDVTSLVSVSRSVVTLLVVVSIVIVFIAPDFYRVVKHGHSEEDSANEKDAA